MDRPHKTFKRGWVVNTAEQQHHLQVQQHPHQQPHEQPQQPQQQQHQQQHHQRVQQQHQSHQPHDMQRQSFPPPKIPTGHVQDGTRPAAGQELNRFLSGISAVRNYAEGPEEHVSHHDGATHEKKAESSTAAMTTHLHGQQNERLQWQTPPQTEVAPSTRDKMIFPQHLKQASSEGNKIQPLRLEGGLLHQPDATFSPGGHLQQNQQLASTSVFPGGGNRPDVSDRRSPQFRSQGPSITQTHRFQRPDYGAHNTQHQLASNSQTPHPGPPLPNWQPFQSAPRPISGPWNRDISTPFSGHQRPPVPPNVFAHEPHPPSFRSEHQSQFPMVPGPPTHPNLNYHPATQHLPRFFVPHQLTNEEPPQKVKSQREEDDDWLKGWLVRTKPNQSERAKEKPVHSSVLAEGCQLIVNLKEALLQLGRQRDMMIRHINREESSWQYECRKVNETKARLEKVESTLFNQDFICQLQRQLKKIRLKRTRRQRQRLRNYHKEQETVTRRKEISERIDANLSRKLHAEQEKKRESELQEDVDRTLFEVRKKKQEASQAMELLKGLRKLRELRKDVAKDKGVHTSRELDVRFGVGLQPLEKLISQRVELYQEEERAMQVMLEEEHEEYKESERRKKAQRHEEKSVRELQEQMKLLFGKDDKIGPTDPRLTFHQFYHQAENNIPALVEIRRQWDQFISETDNEGSSIPTSWVFPSNPSSPSWAAVLDPRNKTQTVQGKTEPCGDV